MQQQQGIIIAQQRQQQQMLAQQQAQGLRHQTSRDCLAADKGRLLPPPSRAMNSPDKCERELEDPSSHRGEIAGGIRDARRGCDGAAQGQAEQCVEHQLLIE
ncbi:hypothetical protein HYDPIDRAFT_119090 [Hydnomerulius pinastri MD-312]|uniref:Unplaced genomic scaffold scaffold_74, whole genome shotgun sequence n=1 Tax=Hydnomerulius pinastri MD-312 TaxID=994086 RepID=A0A0C9W880_9AGAM|nr:hypothetical protein HYDPIDRAFT_119090 [Hydnomerulius pinastri MD-312]